MHKCIVYYWSSHFRFFISVSHILSPSLSAWMTLILRVLCYWLALCWIFQPLCERAGGREGVFWFPGFITHHTHHCECSAIHLIPHKLLSSNNQLTQRTVTPYSAWCVVFCVVLRHESSLSYSIHNASWQLRKYIISFAETLIQWHVRCLNSLSAKDI